MIWVKNVCAIAASIFVLMINASAWATPLIFDFTGTVTDSIFDTRFGNNVTTVTRHPEWNGQQVTGVITLELEGQWKFADEDDPYTIFKSDGSVADSEWMQVKLRNPDGTYFDSPHATYGSSTPFNPLPNSAYTQLTHLIEIDASAPVSNVGFSRRYHNSNSPRPYNYIDLTLIGNGDNAHSLMNSKEYENVVFNPEFANVTNYGAVYQSSHTPTDPDYYFIIDSLSRRGTDVPTPSAPLLLISGLFIVLLIIFFKRYEVVVVIEK
jgi:hypothetical protein